MEKNSDMDTIRQCPLFTGMEDKEIMESITVMSGKTETYKKASVIHGPLTGFKCFGLVLSGSAMACCDDINGNRMIMAAISPGGTFGESLCFLDICDSPVYIYTTGGCEILWLSPKKLFSDDRKTDLMDLRLRFTSLLAGRTLSMNDRIQVLSKLTIREKLLVYFSQLSQKSKSTSFEIPMDRNDMAAYMGTNRSALSRELSKLKSEGIIEYRKNMVTILKKIEI